MKFFAAGFLAWCFLGTSIPAVAQESYGLPSDPVAGSAFGTVIHTQDAEELRYVVLKRLTDRYAERNGIVVTQAEKDAYIARMQATLQQDRERQAARRDELTQKLAAGGLADTEREALASELKTLNQLLENLTEIGQDAAENPQETRVAREQVAAAFIRQWKINQALYQHYGGRIIFQQGGPEPLDAYRKFLEEHLAQGDFAILNKELEAAFWHYYTTDTLHSFFTPGSKEEAQAFDTPWWLKD